MDRQGPTELHLHVPGSGFWSSSELYIFKFLALGLWGSSELSVFEFLAMVLWGSVELGVFEFVVEDRQGSLELMIQVPNVDLGGSS